MITARATASFEPVGRSVAAARAFVRDTLQGWGHSELVDDAVVLTSELVTNAVIHAGDLRRGPLPPFRGQHPRRGLRPLSRAGDPRPERPHAGQPGPRERPGTAALRRPRTPLGRRLLPTRKHVWFHLDLPQRPVGTRSAGPVLPDALLPAAESRVRVAVAQIDRGGAVTAWNEDAQELFGYDADQVTGKPLGDLAAWPHTPGIGTGLAEALRLSRWEGSYGIRCADGRVIPVYASHLRVRDTQGEPSTVCLLVREHERAVLQTPQRPAAEPGESRAADPFEVFIGSPAPDDLDGLLQRTVERARDMLDGDAAFLLLATDDETELEVRATTGLPAARQRFARVPVETGASRYGSARMPAVHEDLAAVPGAVPLLEGTGMRSVVTVPLKVGKLTGSLGVAAESANRYSNEEALRLQFAADRIALAVESARLGELERLRRGSLSFLVEASDLLMRHLGPRPDAGPDGPDDGPDPRHLVRGLHDRRPGLRPVPLVRAPRGRGPHRRPQGPAVLDRAARPGADARRPGLDGPRRRRAPRGAHRLGPRPRPPHEPALLRHRHHPGHRDRGQPARRSSCRWSPVTGSSAC